MNLTEINPTALLDRLAAEGKLKFTDAFECVECSRCGGSGHYSFNLMYGTRCFKCAGNKLTYTKRGAVARERYESHFQVRIDELEVGMKIKTDHGIATVTEVRPWQDGDGGQINKATGKADAEVNADKWQVSTTRIGYSGFKGDHTFRRVATDRNEMIAALTDALDYQSRLTKTGTERKR